MDPRPTLERFADLLVGFGANVQPGQLVAVSSEIGKEPLTRAIAASAYRHGARYVDVAYADPFVRRARIEHGSDEALETVPSWIGERILALGEQRCARIALTGPGRARPARGPRPGARRRATARRRCARPARWSTTARRTGRSAPCPTPGWAALVHPDLDARAGARAAVGADRPRLPPRRARPGRRLARADGDARRRHASASRAARFDALHFEGPGTDLTVGLLPSSQLDERERSRRVDGIAHVPNLPSEEVFTTPDPARVDGVVRATKPLQLGERDDRAA